METASSGSHGPPGHSGSPGQAEENLGEACMEWVWAGAGLSLRGEEH